MCTHTRRRQAHVAPAGTSKSKRATFVARVAKAGPVLTEPTTQGEAIAETMPEARKRRSDVVISRADGPISRPRRFAGGEGYHARTIAGFSGAARKALSASAEGALIVEDRPTGPALG